MRKRRIGVENQGQQQIARTLRGAYATRPKRKETGKRCLHYGDVALDQRIGNPNKCGDAAAQKVVAADVSDQHVALGESGGSDCVRTLRRANTEPKCSLNAILPLTHSPPAPCLDTGVQHVRPNQDHSAHKSLRSATLCSFCRKAARGT